MASIAALTGGALAGLIVAVYLMVFGLVMPHLNQAAIGTAAYTLILVVPLIVAAGLIVGVIVQTFGASM